MKRGDIMYYANIHPPFFDLCELYIRTIDKEDGWFVGVDKNDGVAHLFIDDEIGEVVFHTRDEALHLLWSEEAKYKEENAE